MKGKSRTEGKTWVSENKIYPKIKTVKIINRKSVTGPNFTDEQAEIAMGKALDGNFKEMFLMVLQNQMALQYQLKRILKTVKQLKTDLSVSSKGESARK